MEKLIKKPQQSKGPGEDLAKRLLRLREKLLSKNLDAFLVSSHPNRHYLTSWQGDSESGYLIITQKNSFLITDSRYTEEVTKKVPHFELVEINPYESFWRDFLEKLNLKRIGFESQDLSVSTLKRLKKQTNNVSWYATENFIEELRLIKDKTEINLIKKSISIADLAFASVLKNIKPGLTEIEIANKIETFMREKGSEKNAWENFIVATGANSSMVHYPAGRGKLKKGDMIQLDWGCFYSGYACDISRVIFLGAPSKKQIEIYNLVWQSQQKGFEQIKIGNKTKEIDFAARTFLKNKTDYYFKHAVGHGVGLEVHELPRINEKSEEKIVPGQIFTVEPGVYIPNWGGVRLEDMVLVTDKGWEVLTKSAKKIEDVTVN